MRVTCTECKHYREVVFTGPGAITEGKCSHADTLHPETYGWNSCHLSRKRAGRYLSMTTPSGQELTMDMVAYRNL